MSAHGEAPLPRLLLDSLDPSELGAPVERELLVTAAGGAVALLAAALFGRFLADPSSGGWIFFDGLVAFFMNMSAAVATPAGVLALAVLALDAILASGIPAGSWARGACVVQIAAAALAALPLLAIVTLAALTIAAYLAIACVVVFLIGLLLSGS